MKETSIEERCYRCGYLNDLEKHHKNHRIDGGGDEPKNIVFLCRACHDYQHAKDACLKAIKAEQSRLDVLNKRLEIIEKENTPLNILSRGYQPYFELYREPIPPQTKCGRYT